MELMVGRSGKAEDFFAVANRESPRLGVLDLDRRNRTGGDIEFRPRS
jgi:hypothetical protein